MANEVKQAQKPTEEQKKELAARAAGTAPAPDAEGQFLMAVTCGNCGTPNRVSSYWNVFICAWCGEPCAF